MNFTEKKGLDLKIFTSNSSLLLILLISLMKHKKTIFKIIFQKFVELYNFFSFLVFTAVKENTTLQFTNLSGKFTIEAIYSINKQSAIFIHKIIELFENTIELIITRRLLCLKESA